MVDSHGRNLAQGFNSQVVSLLSMKFWLAKGSKQAPHVGGSITI